MVKPINIIENKMDWLQVLRGVAALMVVLFHMKPHWELAPPLNLFAGLMKFGFAGVDVFFILSGFVVYTSARRASISNATWSFVKRRVLRIYMGYWPILIMTATSSFFIYHSELPSTRKIVGSFFLLFPSIFDNWLPTAWSLTYELYFYAWIVCIIWLPSKYRFQSIVTSMLILSIWNAAWLLISPQTVYDGDQPMRFFLTAYGLEFLLGAFLVEVFQKFKNDWPTPKTMLPLCISLIFIGFAIGTTSKFFDRVELMRVASFGVFALGLFLIILTMQVWKFNAPKLLILIGDSSFSLYLLHPFLLGLIGDFRYKFIEGNHSLVLLMSLLIPIVVVYISILWFRHIEYPLMQLIHQR